MPTTTTWKREPLISQPPSSNPHPTQLYNHNSCYKFQESQTNQPITSRERSLPGYESRRPGVFGVGWGQVGWDEQGAVEAGAECYTHVHAPTFFSSLKANVTLCRLGR